MSARAALAIAVCVGVICAGVFLLSLPAGLIVTGVLLGALVLASEF